MTDLIFLCDSLCKYCSKYLFRSTFLVINHRCEIHCTNKPLGHKFSKAGDHNQLTGVINAKIIACYSSLEDHHQSNLCYKSLCWFFVQILLQIFVQSNIFGHKFCKASDHNQLTGAINAKIIACHSRLQDHCSNYLCYKIQCLYWVELFMGLSTGHALCSASEPIEIEGTVEISQSQRSHQIFSQQCSKQHLSQPLSSLKSSHWLRMW